MSEVVNVIKRIVIKVVNENKPSFVGKTISVKQMQEPKKKILKNLSY